MKLLIILDYFKGEVSIISISDKDFSNISDIGEFIINEKLAFSIEDIYWMVTDGLSSIKTYDY